MKEFIEQYYDIKIISCENDYIKDTKNNIYIFKLVNDVNKNIIDYLFNTNYQNIKLYKIVFNRFKSLYTNYNDGDYALIKLDTNYNCYIDFLDTVDFYKNSEKLLGMYKNNIYSWESFWEYKIDNVTKRFIDNHVLYKNLESLFCYYIGVAETSLFYLKDINRNIINHDAILSLSHYRVHYPLKNKDFYNPLNIIVDFRVRDIGEYIKSCFYNNQNYVDELKYFLKIMNFSQYEASLLYARILYPSVFIDYFISEKNENYNMFYQTDKYQEFLKKTYELISSYVHINGVFWIIDPH